MDKNMKIEKLQISDLFIGKIIPLEDGTPIQILELDEKYNTRIKVLANSGHLDLIEGEVYRGWFSQLGNVPLSIWMTRE